MDSPHTLDFFDAISGSASAGTLSLQILLEALEKYPGLAEKTPFLLKRVPVSDRIALLAASLEAAVRLCDDDLFDELPISWQSILGNAGSGSPMWADWARRLSASDQLRQQVGEDTYLIWMAQIAGNRGGCPVESALLLPLAQKNLAAQTNLALVEDMLDAVASLAGVEAVSDMRLRLRMLEESGQESVVSSELAPSLVIRPWCSSWVEMSGRSECVGGSRPRARDRVVSM